MLSNLFVLPDQPRVVLDTNTILALWLFEDPGLAYLRAALAAGRFCLLAREDCLEELRRVLAYPQFKVEPERQAALLAGYRAQVECVAALEVMQPLPACRDSDDQKFLEAAVQGRADLLVSRDKAVLRAGRHRLLRERLKVMTPEQLEQLLQQNASA